MNREKAGKAFEETVGTEAINLEKLEEGLIHETYSAEAEGREYIIQFSGKDDENHSALEKCLEMYRLLEGTVPVPETVTDEIREIEGDRYVIVEKIDGKSGEKDISPDKTGNAGKTLAEIHSFTQFEREGWIEFEGNDQRITEFREKSLKRKKLSELEEKIEVFEEKGLEELAESLEAFIEEYGEIFPENFEAVLVHDDFTPDNVIFLEEEVNGVIDMDYAYSGLDVRNVVKSANAFWMHDPVTEWDVRETFYEGYRRERPLPEDFEPLEMFFRVETLIQLVGSMLKLDELSEREQEFYREKLLEEIQRSREGLKPE